PPIFFLVSLSRVPPPPSVYTLSLHDALPISSSRYVSASRGLRNTSPALGASPSGRYVARACGVCRRSSAALCQVCAITGGVAAPDRKSTRLNSSHEWISYAVFCLKKKNRTNM